MSKGLPWSDPDESPLRDIVAAVESALGAEPPNDIVAVYEQHRQAALAANMAALEDALLAAFIEGHGVSVAQDTGEVFLDPRVAIGHILYGPSYADLLTWVPSSEDTDGR